MQHARIIHDQWSPFRRPQALPRIQHKSCECAVDIEAVGDHVGHVSLDVPRSFRVSFEGDVELIFFNRLSGFRAFLPDEKFIDFRRGS